MADSVNENRPVRKLTVRNFSVIREAELEFGKITVLIGPQASGKSLLCKLAYFLGGEIVGIAVESLLDGSDWDQFTKAVEREFHSRFSTNGWLKTNLKVKFSSDQFWVEISSTGDPLTPQIEFNFCDPFAQRYRTIQSNPFRLPQNLNASRSELRQDLWVEISLLLNRRRNQANVYIPSGRAALADLGSANLLLQNPDLDQITKQFVGRVPWDNNWKFGLLTTGRGVTQSIEREMHRIANGTVVVIEGRRLFLSIDGRTMPLSLQSSGTLELLPMFNLLNYLAFLQEHFHARYEASGVSPVAEVVGYGPIIYLEEPETSLFPSSQYDIVRLLAWLSSDPVLSFDWAITTHSPYILSVFGDLIKAGKVGPESPEHHAAVSKVIPEKYWIRDGDFAAYKIEQGNLVSIFDKKTGQIDGDYLDDVSGKISDEFGQLLEIQYGH